MDTVHWNINLDFIKHNLKVLAMQIKILLDSHISMIQIQEWSILRPMQFWEISHWRICREKISIIRAIFKEKKCNLNLIFCHKKLWNLNLKVSIQLNCRMLKLFLREIELFSKLEKENPIIIKFQMIKNSGKHNSWLSIRVANIILEI